MEQNQALTSRILEPEVMDTAEKTAEYDAMDHSEVNCLFVDDLLMHWGKEAALNVFDVGTGTALIPIELAKRCVNFQITAIDLSSEMLKRTEQNVKRAGLADRIELKRVDAKQLQQHSTGY